MREGRPFVGRQRIEGHEEGDRIVAARTRQRGGREIAGQHAGLLLDRQYLGQFVRGGIGSELFDARFDRADDAAERTGRAPPSGPAEKQVRIDRRDLVEARLPIGDDPVGMIVRRIADRREHVARQCRRRDLARPVPIGLRIGARQRPVAGEGELATGGAFRPLKHHAAHAFGKGRVAQSVQHDLCDGALPLRIVAGLVQHGGGEAVGRAGPIVEVASKAERSRRRVGAGNERHLGIEGAGVLRFQRAILDRLHRGRRRFRGLRNALAARSGGMRRRPDRRGRPDQDRRHGDGRDRQCHEDAVDRDRSAADPAPFDHRRLAHCSGRKSGTDR
ncbi:hypothetical protein ASE70_01210 [Sphingomonas sp. Leaf22]|nr:hypothetical protein ASE70_01210 [Sphingomonas sp. Leaf22]